MKSTDTTEFATDAELNPVPSRQAAAVNEAGVRLSLSVEPDGKIVEFAAMTDGSAVLEARSAVFDPNDVGKAIVVAGAGPIGTKLVSTIMSVESPTSVTLASVAASSTDSRGATLGTDCGPALSTAFTALTEAGGGELVIDGLFFLRTSVAVDFTNNTAEVSIVGSGGDSGLIVATDADQDALVLSGAGRVLVDGVNFIGTPLEPVDARRALSFISCFITLRNCGFFGIACIGAADGAVVYAESTDLSSENNFFGSSVGGLGNPTVMNRNFAGFRSSRDRFLDYGRFQGILFIKTGLSFTKAWIFGENQFAEDANAVGQSVFRVVDSHFDEGHVYAVAVTAELGSGKRVARVEISGLQANNTLVNGGSAIYLERVDHATIDQPAIGWANAPRNGLVLNDCGIVQVLGAVVTAGAPGTPTGMADGILATDVESLVLEDSDFARFNFTRVLRFQQITAGVGGVVPFQKSGRITDADFDVPPPIGTIGVDLAGKRLYARFTEGWLAGPVMVTSTDPTLVLHNVTPATGAVSPADTFTKTSGADSWSNCSANLNTTVTGSFRMIIKFGDVSASRYVRAGAEQAVDGINHVTEQNDLSLGVLQDNATNIYLINHGSLFAGPWPYGLGQEVKLSFDARTGIVILTINGLIRYNGKPVLSGFSADMEHRFSSTLYSVGSGFQLLEYTQL